MLSKLIISLNCLEDRKIRYFLFLPACANIMAHLDAFQSCFFALSLHASVCQNNARSEHIKPFTLIFKQVAYLKRMFFQ